MVYDLVSDVPRTPEWSPDLRDDLHQNMTTSLGTIAEIAAGQEPGRPSAATARTS
jgi:hypothetical protein